MKKFSKEGIKSDKGFTMIELIIVIAILGILAAILVPSFTEMTRKSRLKADVSTARQFQTQMDLFVADHDGQYPDGEATAPGAGVAGEAGLNDAFNTVQAAIEGLIAEGYIKESDANEGVTDLDLQTASAVTEWNTTKEQIELDLDATTDNIQSLGDRLTPKEQEWIKQ